ncbi:MAG: tetratricopeptide repeat protein [Candidatus Krumholzibacteria bacterium]|nr:tetratricopeptide repeat protein [Candidatus Krumholzibacteria bacterium]MDH4337237.1 tetratricopeptide repeat protein [Candidatus Krumholzibacteria bacterium]MDH5268699.1 tetratricopeptide repeat protein [Candidatus Krumholzibacteria bacterium]
MLTRARIACGIVAALTAVAPLVHAARPTPPVAPAVQAPLPHEPDASERDATSLGRAVDLWLKGDLYGASALLETIDIGPGSPFPFADRAAFLLADAYLRTGNAGGFARVASLAGDGNGTPYRRWIRYAELLRANANPGASGPVNDVPESFPGADVLAAALLLDADRANDALDLLDRNPAAGPLASVQLCLRALAREATGADATANWGEIARRKPSGPLEAELVGAAGIRFALARMDAGDTDAAASALERVPDNSRYALRAAHMRGVMAVEAGDTATAGRILSRLVDEHPEYEDIRDVKLAMGGVSMARHHWHAALRYFESAEDSWQDEQRSLARIALPDNVDDAWNAWGENQRWREEIRLSPEILLGVIDGLAGASLDLHGQVSLDPAKDLARTLWPAGLSAPATAAWDSSGALARHAPSAPEWATLRALQAQQQDARARLALQDHVIARRREEIARRISYLDIGAIKADSNAVQLSRAVIRLEAILAGLDASRRQLDAVRDSMLVQISRRTRDMLTGLERDLLFMRAVRHFHVDGPNLERPEKLPDGVPPAAELLAREDSLSHESSAFITEFARRYPDIINRSFDEYWRPRLMVDVEGLLGDLRIELAHARGIRAGIDSTVAAFATDPVLMAELARRDHMAASADSLDAVERGMRRVIAQTVAARGRVLLATERERIDYHIADAAYELTVATATDTVTNRNAELVRPLRNRSIAYLEAFLEHHPQSIARGEARFRLADMQLLAARDEFQIRMRDFLGDRPASEDLGNRALAPFMNYEPAIALYQAILDEDPEFPHTDAVLFNLGMILSDDGRPEADQYLARLVRDHPQAPDAQEAWLRMGSDRFDRKEYSDCVPYFEQAAAGSDPSFTAIALYKLGWAEFARDRFEQSTDSFRRLMDHYAAHGDIARSMDLRDEAREYLVHSLARAGGASAFQRYFDSLGPRDYESDILLSLGHLMRSVSLYEDAIACDELWLARYPRDPRALEIAERMVETYRRSSKPDLAREARLAQAQRFLPGSPWYQANTDPATRAAGEAFAQGALRANAAYHHRRARDNDDPASWRLALTNYEQYLQHWPNAGDATRIHFFAGEAATRLTAYPRSLQHLAAASKSDSTALALEATWQQVAVTDTWYRSTHTEAGHGTDSLATVLIASGRAFVQRFPTDPRCADIVWRQGNVAYAHAWYPDAAAIFETFGNTYPADSRAARGARLGGDAHYKRADFHAAGIAYRRAVDLATQSGEDSLVAAVKPTIPLCDYKHAESVAAADSVRGPFQAAPLFAGVATEFPAYPHADLALYRAGLGYASGLKYRDATVAWERLLATYPESEYARDSAIQIARTHEAAGDTPGAAAAYERFSRLYVKDPDAPAALIKAADMLADAGDAGGAERMRSIFIQRFPGDTQTVMEIRASRASQELARVRDGAASMSVLMAKPGANTSSSELREYLALAKEHPEMASPVILAQVDYYDAEESFASFSAMRLTQPLPASLEKKKQALESLLEKYNTCSGHGVAEYTRASAYRIGQALVGFGDALMQSERPGDLEGEDLLAYEDVIEEQAWVFYDRGENVWSDMLRQIGDTPDDPGQWIAHTRAALWPRLSQRFMYRPEPEYPVLVARPPAEPETD